MHVHVAFRSKPRLPGLGAEAEHFAGLMEGGLVVVASRRLGCWQGPFQMGGYEIHLADAVRASKVVPHSVDTAIVLYTPNIPGAEIQNTSDPHCYMLYDTTELILIYIIYVYMYTCIYVYVYVCICICMYIYIYVQIL